MKAPTLVLIVIILMLVFACSDEHAVVSDKPSQKLSEDNAFKAYETSLDKAKGVEQTIQDAAEQRAEEIDRQN